LPETELVPDSRESEPYRSRVSVVIISLNSERSIGQCVKSLEEQSVSPHEAIVVDGKSSDSTMSILEEIKGGLHFPLRVIPDVEGNRSTSRNIGLRSSRGEIVAFLDADCVAPRDWIRNIEMNMGSNPNQEKAICGPYVPAQGTGFAKATYCLLGETSGKLATQFLRREDHQRYVRTILGGDSAFARELLLEVNGFDERLNWCEDVDLSNRIRASGARIAFVPQLYVLHSWSGWNGLRSLVRSSFSYGRNRAVAAKIKKSLSPRSTLSLYLVSLVAFILLAGYSVESGTISYLVAGLLVLYLSACTLIMSFKRSLDAKAILSVAAFFVAYGVGLFEGFLEAKTPTTARWDA
jgi:glycosyltransferase involved in cell wall biosynthesis